MDVYKRERKWREEMARNLKGIGEKWREVNEVKGKVEKLSEVKRIMESS